MRLKGRHWIALWLLTFLAVGGIVVSRQTRAHLLAGQLREAAERRRVREAEVAELIRAIQRASSRDVIGQKAGAMGLRVATGAEITILPIVPDSAGDR
jgi:hypothetical protein